MNTDTPVLLLLGGAYSKGGTYSNTGWMCVHQARSRGLKIWLTDTEENLANSPELAAAADKVTPLSYRDREACVAWSIEQARTTSFVGVYSYREFAVETVAAVSEALGLPGNALADVERVRNKLACRQALRARGFHQPAIALCSSLHEAQAFIADHPNGSWIVKPPAAMGSAGVSLVRDMAELEQAISYLAESCAALAGNFKQQGIIEKALLHAATVPFLIACFQPGEEYSAEGVFVYGQPHVVAATAKLTAGTPHFVEIGHSIPAELDPAVFHKVKETVESALLALNLKWGQFHVEFWIDNGEVVLGEVHVRPGGDFIHYMTQYVTGIELYGVVFDQMLGRQVDMAKYQPQRGAAITFFTPPAGLVSAISGWEEAIADPHCLIAELNMKVGDHIGPIYSSTDRHAFIVVGGATAQEAKQHRERLTAAIQIQVQEETVSAG
jgi:biotin carboxylase